MNSRSAQKKQLKIKIIITLYWLNASNTVCKLEPKKKPKTCPSKAKNIEKSKRNEIPATGRPNSAQTTNQRRRIRKRKKKKKKEKEKRKRKKKKRERSRCPTTAWSHPRTITLRTEFRPSPFQPAGTSTGTRVTDPTIHPPIHHVHICTQGAG
ncbi:hypothetical protein B9Z19DRAFT_659107 [Tuber borchii]|uniref:Uncharacterized protein n=1 Tax=Tuber borchii TaxID=42251 RepID=A0A2T6ZAL7_TUBBO|nr:hypothetical protein B9Z19DRAFT_659107 [Tuber borchii]